MRNVVAVLALLALSSQVSAAQLVSCTLGVTPMGVVAWIGTYKMPDGTLSKVAFPQSQFATCPTLI